MIHDGFHDILNKGLICFGLGHTTSFFLKPSFSIASAIKKKRAILSLKGLLREAEEGILILVSFLADFLVRKHTNMETARELRVDKRDVGDPNVCRLDIVGAIDLANIAVLATLLESEPCKSAARLDLDMSGVHFLDSQTANLLMAVQRSRRGMPDLDGIENFRVLHPSRIAQKVFDCVNLHLLIPIVN
jgi:hypothetical protein